MGVFNVSCRMASAAPADPTPAQQIMIKEAEDIAHEESGRRRRRSSRRARAPVMNKRIHRLIPPHATRLPPPETRPRRIHPVGNAAPVAGVADPGRGAQRLSEHLFSRGVGIGFESVRSYPAFEGCGPKAKCGNRGHRSRLQGRLGRLRQRVFFCS
jgi:hypothetical protein